MDRRILTMCLYNRKKNKSLLVFFISSEVILLGVHNSSDSAKIEKNLGNLFALPCRAPQFWISFNCVFACSSDLVLQFLRNFEKAKIWFGRGNPAKLQCLTQSEFIAKKFPRWFKRDGEHSRTYTSLKDLFGRRWKKLKLLMIYL